MADDLMWSSAPARYAYKSYSELSPSGVNRDNSYSTLAAPAATRGRTVTAAYLPLRSHPSGRFTSVPDLRMRNPYVPYKSTGFAPRPSKCSVSGIEALPVRMATSAAKLPDNFCYTQKDLTDARDQGQCGSCWAMSSTAALSDRVAIASQGKIKRPLSVQQMMECSSYGNAAAVGCEGNQVVDSLQSLKDKGVFLMDQDEYPRKYTAQSVNAADCSTSERSKHFGVGVKDVFTCCDTIPKTGGERQAAIDANVMSMKQTIYNEGPIVVIFAVPSDFQNYDGLSIYDAPDGFDADSSSSLHAVECLGWGKSKAGHEYWICRNTWGPKWPSSKKPGAGEGAFYMALGKNCCNIESWAVVAVPNVRNGSSAIGTGGDGSAVAFGVLIGVAAAGAIWLYLNRKS